MGGEEIDEVQYRLGDDMLERSTAEDLFFLVDSRLGTNSSVSLWSRRPVVSWDTLKRAWPAG